MNNDEHRRRKPLQKSNQYSQYISKLYLKLPTPRLPFALKTQFPWKSSIVGKIPLGGFNVLQPGWPGSLPKPSHCCQDSLPSSNSMVSRFISRSISSHTLPTTWGLSFLSYWTWMNHLVFLDDPSNLWYFPPSFLSQPSGIFGPITGGFFLNHLNLTKSHQSTKDIDCLPTPIFTFLHPDISDDRELELEIILRWLPISKPSFPVTSVLVHLPK